MMMLKVGRHFRLSDDVKVIVGRDEAENSYLERFAEGRGEVWVEEYPSPLTLIEGQASARDLERACAITARYCDGRDQETVPVKWRLSDAEGQLRVSPADDDQLEEMRI
jgi:predicted ribosome quality control (RQC) complex YloA/Tae2 family protein